MVLFGDEGKRTGTGLAMDWLDPTHLTQDPTTEVRMISS